MGTSGKDDFDLRSLLIEAKLDRERETSARSEVAAYRLLDHYKSYIEIRAREYAKTTGVNYTDLVSAGYYAIYKVIAKKGSEDMEALEGYFKRAITNSIRTELKLLNKQRSGQIPFIQTAQDGEEYDISERLSYNNMNPDSRVLFEELLYGVRRIVLEEGIPETWLTIGEARAAGLSYGEIAEFFDIPIGTVRSRLNRLRSRIEKYLPNIAA